MNWHDLKQQKLFIVLAVTSIDDMETSNYHVNRRGVDYILNEKKVANIFMKSNNDLIFNRCRNIIDRIEEGAIYNKDKTKVNWIGVTMGGLEEIHWNVTPLSFDLYGGVGGIAIFLHAFTKTFHNNCFQVLCDAVDATLEEHLNNILLLKEKLVLGVGSSGGFVGECSLMYVYMTLFRITQKENYWKNAEMLYDIVKIHIENDDQNDIMSGNACAILVLIKMYQLCGEDMYLQLAIDAGNVFVDNGKKEEKKIGWTLPGQNYSISGLLHGFSGIALALFKLGKVSGVKQFGNIAKEAILEENSMYLEKFKNWADRRIFKGKTGEEIGNNPVTWCHGAAGILLARIKMYPYVEEEFRSLIKKDIKRAAKTLKELGGLKNQCLCHGQIGNMEILREYALFIKDIKIESMCNDMLKCILQSAENYWDCGLIDEHEHFGFMLCISGIGYSLLRTFNHDLPCVLALD
jgi:type 2 lantibiotic biosynthesis protein LanM